MVASVLYCEKSARAFFGRARAIGLRLRDDARHAIHRREALRIDARGAARNDDARAPAEKDTLREAAKAAGRPAELEVYNADHGWCTLDAPIYDKAEAERAWARLLALYKGAL